jgi:hypothetical protein
MNHPTFDPTTPTDYLSVLGNPALQLKHQEQLDAFFQSRIVKVRVALRALGWTGEAYKTLNKEGYTLTTEFQTVGGAANVVGWKITVAAHTCTDLISMAPPEFAAYLDRLVPMAIPLGIVARVRADGQLRTDARRLPQVIENLRFLISSVIGRH